MATQDNDVHPYELLGITIEATESEIKTAYRQRSLKVHPDRHPNNPEAASKFHELNQAYELLLDPIRKTALDASLRTKLARKERFAKFDVKRKGMQSELEEAERAVKRTRVERAKEEQERKEEAERIKEEGRRLREEKQKEIFTRAQEERMRRTETQQEERIQLGPLDTTVRLKYPLSQYPALTTTASLCEFLSTFGPVDEPSIVISMKPPKKFPNKPPQQATALIPFRNIGDAYAVVSASGKDSERLQNIDVSWAAGKEPEMLDRLIRRDGNRTDAKKDRNNESNNVSASKESFAASQSSVSEKSTSFPSSSLPSFSFVPSASQTMSGLGDIPGLDYESITMMRLRKAERERLEREIREQDDAS